MLILILDGTFAYLRPAEQLGSLSQCQHNNNTIIYLIKGNRNYTASKEIIVSSPWTHADVSPSWFYTKTTDDIVM